MALLESVRTKLGTAPKPVDSTEADLEREQKTLGDLRNRVPALEAKIRALNERFRDNSLTSQSRGERFLSGEERLTGETIRAETRALSNELEDVRAAIPVQERVVRAAENKFARTQLDAGLRDEYRAIMEEMAAAVMNLNRIARREAEFKARLAADSVRPELLPPTPFLPHHFPMPRRYIGGRVWGWFDWIEQNHGIKVDEP